MDIQFVSEIISSVAIVLSLIFVVYQIYQNTKAQKALVVDSLAKAIADINAPLTSDPQVGISISKALKDWEAATPEDKARAHYFLFSIFKLSENAWFQKEAGVLSDEQWNGWEAMALYYYRSDGVTNHWWKMRGGGFSVEFSEHLKNSTREIKVSPLDEIMGGVH